MLLLFVGDATIETEPPENANWGGQRLLKVQQARFGRKTGDYSAWLESTYFPQVRQLKNFLNYVKASGRVVLKIVADEHEARTAIRHFLVSQLRLNRPAGEPFKRLEKYDEDDDEIFFGRDAVRSATLERFRESWNSGRVPFLTITGGSGVGKSSFLRAGLMARLLKYKSEGDFTGVVLGPEQLLPAQNTPVTGDGILTVVFEALRKEIAPSDFPIDWNAWRSTERPARAVEWLIGKLEAQQRLVLGLDQFEALIDRRADPATSPLLDPLLVFIETGLGSGRMGVIVTCPENRLELIGSDPVLAALYQGGEDRPLGFPEDFDQIVARSFLSKRVLNRPIRVEPRLLKKIRDTIRAFASAPSSLQMQGSLLPLVSVGLARLFARTEPLLSEQISSGGPPGRGPAEEFLRVQAPSAGELEDRFVTLTLQAAEPHLGFEDAIGELADEAVKAASGAPGGIWDDTAIGALLRRLVRRADRRRDLFQLPGTNLPSRGAVGRLAAEFRKHRLLVDAGHGRERLVHEAVLRHWPKAKAWLKEENALLERAERVLLDADAWEKRDRPNDAFGELGKRDIEDAALLLANWFDIFTPGEDWPVEPDDALLRDYALSLLRERPELDGTVRNRTDSLALVHLAVVYGDVVMFERILAREPECLAAKSEQGRSVLYYGAIGGTTAMIQRVLDLGGRDQVTAPDVNGWHPLHAAVDDGHEAVVDKLIDAGAHVDQRGPGGWTALMVALASSRPHDRFALHLLDQHHADPLIAAEDGWSPFQVACRYGIGSVVIRLLENPDLDPNGQSERVWPGLHLAVLGGQTTIARALLDHPRVDTRLLTVGASRTSIAHLAATSNSDEMAELVTSHPRTDLNLQEGASGKTALQGAIESGRDDRARAILRAGANPDVPDNAQRTPLHAAARAGRLSAVRLLLDERASVDPVTPQGETPFVFSLELEHADVATLLLEGGANVDVRVKGITPLQGACRDGRLVRTRFLVEHGADILAVTEDGWTPLHFAVEEDKDEVVRYLLTQEKVLAQIRGERRAPAVETPLHVAAKEGSARSLDLLLEAGARTDVRDAHGWSALHIAAQSGRAAIVRRLGRREQIDDRAGEPAMTPLQAAAEAGSVEVVGALIDLGASLQAETEDRGSPSYLAVKSGHYDVAVRLLDAGADPRLSDGGRVPDLATLVRDREHRRTASHEPTSEIEQHLLARVRELGYEIGGVVAAPTAASAQQPGLQPAAAQDRWDAGRAFEALRLTGTVDTRRLGPVGGTLHQRVIADIGPSIPVAGTLLEVASVAVPWYENRRLARVQAREWHPGRAFYYLVGGSIIYRLDGQSQPIHEANESFPIRLTTPESVLGYLRFFCFFVRGEEGPFYVLDDPADPIIPADLDEKVRNTIAAALRPPQLTGTDEQDRFLCAATISYGTALFNATLAVARNGVIEMLTDEPIASDLPFRVVAPLT